MRGSFSTAALALTLTGCRPGTVVDVTISYDPSAATPAAFDFQSETSMARVEALDPFSRQPTSHLVTVYNDGSSVEVPAPVPQCWGFTGSRSLDGWSTSDDFARTWTRHPQLPPSDSSFLRGRHGDVYVASWSNPDFSNLLQLCQGSGGVLCDDGDVVLMVSVGQLGTTPYDGPWGIYANRMIFTPNDRAIDLTRDPEVALSSGEAIPDGPKVAIRGDGSEAIITWQAPYSYLQVNNLHLLLGGFMVAPMAFGPPQVLNPMMWAPPPDTSCTSAEWIGIHAQIAGGARHFYAAGVWDYVGCKDPDPVRIEVYRTETGDRWERILSVRSPKQFAVAHGLLNTQNLYTQPFGNSTDRGEDGLSLAVVESGLGEDVVLVTDQSEQGDATLNEASRERVIQYRVRQADRCVINQADLFSCGNIQNLAPQVIDTIAVANGMRTIASRAGVWESKPHVFSGSLADGFHADPRVGIIWYTQPYKGLLTATPEMATRTIVEAVVSADGGVSYQGPFNMTAGTGSSDPAIGTYFYPCPFLAPPFIPPSCHSNGYFGEYISGLFVTPTPTDLSVVGAWGDSREGCVKEGVPTFHQHVWGGYVVNQ